jgi:hypothetical protein
MQCSGTGVSGMSMGTVVTDCHELVPLTLPCTVYDVMGVPPSDVGGFHFKLTLFKPDCAVKPVGAPGAAYVDAVAFALGGPWPTAFTAIT